LYLQIDADYIPKVEGTLNGYDGEGKVLSGMLSLKGYFPVATRLKPYVIVGAGILHYNIDDPDNLEDDRDTDFCAKIGGGFLLQRLRFHRPGSKLHGRVYPNRVIHCGQVRYGYGVT